MPLLLLDSFNRSVLPGLRVYTNLIILQDIQKAGTQPLPACFSKSGRSHQDSVDHSMVPVLSLQLLVHLYLSFISISRNTGLDWCSHTESRFLAHCLSVLYAVFLIWISSPLLSHYVENIPLLTLHLNSLLSQSCLHRWLFIQFIKHSAQKSCKL